MCYSSKSGILIILYTGASTRIVYCPTKAKCSNYVNIETEKNAFKVFILAGQTCCRYNSGDTFNEYLYRKENCIEKEKTNDMTFDLKIVDTALCLCITSNN